MIQLAFFNNLFLLNTFVDRISKPHVIAGLVLAVIGFACALLARRIASVARKQEEKSNPVGNDNKVYIFIKGLGLVFLLVALIILMFE